MKWHCYSEEYETRKINGKLDPWMRYLTSPEFAVSDRGDLNTHDASLKTEKGETAWLLSCAPSDTYVAYQPNAHDELPIEMDCPVAEVECDNFPFGKLVLRRADAGDVLEVGMDVTLKPFYSRGKAKTHQRVGNLPGEVRVKTDAKKVRATVNGEQLPLGVRKEDGQRVRVINPYAKGPVKPVYP